jgi:aminoglycoside 3-N-acetyltransferase I
MSIDIKKLSREDLDEFKRLILLFEDVFKMEGFQMPDDAYLQQLLGKDSFFVFVALSDNNIVGGLTAYTLQQYYSKLPLVYVYDFAVKTEFQRQGIGKVLIASITNYCKEIGVEEVFVQADEVDDYAIEFYTSTGARNENVRHFYYPLNTQ